VFAGVLKYQRRSCERSRGHESASRGCKSANKGRESACIALECTTRGLEIVGEIVRVFAGPIKGHGNEADFLGFLQKLVPHESITLPFGPFQFWLRIRGLSVSVIRGVADSLYR
jgi:hypothetical protein